LKHAGSILNAERRIRRLELGGPGHAELQQAFTLVEDAFRIAALPGIPPGAEIVIHRLDLGPLRLDRPSSRLAEAISALVRNLAAGMVCVDERSGSSRDAVWFSNPIQPYQSLLLKLLKGDSPTEWYWRSLFPGRSMELNTETVGWLLLESRQTPLQALAPSHLLQAAIQAHRWPSLLPFITPGLARRMLHEAGESPAALVSRRVQERGADVPDPPDSLPAPDLDSNWRRALQEAAETWGREDVRSSWLAWHALVLHQPAWLMRAGAMQRIKLATWLKDDAGPRGVPEKSAFKTSPAQDTKMFKGVLPSGAGKGGVGLRAASPGGSSLFDVSPLPALCLVQSGRGPGSPPKSPRVQQRPKARPQDHPGPEHRTRDLPLFSASAGFGLAVALLQRVAMDELLDRNEQLIELDFPLRLLRALADRFGLPDEDPTRGLFESLEPGRDAGIGEVHLPDRWRGMTTLSGRPLRQPGGSLQELLVTAQHIAAVCLRRLCGVSLRRLVNRPGRVSLTATHWDVLFDINQTDIRLRRVALDADPGWVAWLGRVVRFHYLEQ